MIIDNFYSSRSYRIQHKSYRILCACIMKYLFWIFLVSLVVFRILTNKPSFSEGDHVRIATRVANEPIRYSNSRGMKVKGLWAYLPLYPEINYGDSIVVEGVVGDGKLEGAKLIEIAENQGFLYRTRKRILEVYNKSLPSPHSSLVAGMVLGSKENIPREFWENLKLTGTAHVVVASGMNVTLVAGFLIGILILFFPRRKAILLALVGIWTYALIAGFDAPIIRAAVMGTVGFSAVALGRLGIAWRALLLAALAMLVVNPEWLTDLGFILSFVATASLMLFERRIRKLARPIPRIIREDFSTSLAAQIGVAPILFVTFGYFNILSPIINTLILWTVAPITMIAAVAGMIGLVFPALAGVLLLTAYPLTWWFVSVVEMFS